MISKDVAFAHWHHAYNKIGLGKLGMAHIANAFPVEIKHIDLFIQICGMF